MPFDPREIEAGAPIDLSGGRTGSDGYEDTLPLDDPTSATGPRSFASGETAALDDKALMAARHRRDATAGDQHAGPGASSAAPSSGRMSSGPQTAAIGVLERYEIIEELGRGGFGVVHKARQLATGQTVAIKTLLLEAAPTKKAQDEQIARFRREMSLIARLNDPHTVRLFDSGLTEDGHPFMVLEYVEGHELATLLAESEGLDPDLVKRLTMQVLQALAEAHEHGIVHRDLKPENIMVTGKGRRTAAKVLDFGIAGIQDEHKETTDEGITVAGQVRGTPSYMAPEQLQLFGEARPETDIYAVGLILLECLTGKKAVTADSAPLVCFKQMQEDVEIPPDIASTPFGLVVRTATQKKPEARFSSAEEMLDVIAAIDLESASFRGIEGSSAWQKIERATTGAQGNEPEDTVADILPGRGGLWVVLVLLLAAVGVAGYLFATQAPSPPADGPPQEGTKAPTPTVAGPAAQHQTRAASVAAAVGTLHRETSSSDALIADAMARARMARREKRFEEAIVAYDQVLALAPKHYDALKEKGWSLVDLDRFSEAIEWLVLAFEMAPEEAEMDEELYLTLAVAYDGSGNVDEAVEVYDKFLEKFPDSNNANLVRMQKIDIERSAEEDKKRRRRRRPRRASRVRRPVQFD